MEYELNAIHDSRKSFYNKAIVREEDGKKKLYSYNTLVCFIENNKPIVLGAYSQTTLRHIKEFLKQNGFKAETSSQILNDYPETEEFKKEQQEKAEGILKSVKMVCAFGDILNNTQKEKNDFKARILKAGLENRGLIMPNDWNELSESEKESRLNKAIEQL
jgi:hypothetical protein